ncbi:MAG: Na+/H+ antiporter NhaC family protein [Streptosporangiales bacterium]
MSSFASTAPTGNRLRDSFDRKRVVALVTFAVAIGVAVVLAVQEGKAGLWGITPIVAYAVLAIVGVDVVIATIAAVIVAAVMTMSGPVAMASLLGESLGSFIAVVGLIVILGAGLGQVARETGAAQTLVRTVMQRVGLNTPTRVQIGVMLSSFILVAALGTLAGANAILAPIIIPIAAAVRWRPPAVAAMLHSAGAAGLFVGPFTPPVVTIIGAADLSYPAYLASAGLPMAAVTGLTGFAMARWLQRRATAEYDAADVQLAEEAQQGTRDAGGAPRRATWAFVVSLAALTVLGVALQAGYSYALIVMMVTALVTGLAGGLSPVRIAQAVYTGASKLLWLFMLFWLFNPLLELVDKTGAYQSLLHSSQPVLTTVGTFGFCILALMIGWVGVAGAAVAQVVLMDKLFAPIVASLGIPPTAWAAVLLGSSQIDWFGPFPNADMVGQMGLARSNNLRLMMFNGWAIMLANTALFAVLFLVLL